jgi:hypothetical protein
MTQIRIFEIEDESDEDEYHPKTPKYSSIVEEEDYEDEEDQPVPWDFREDAYFQITTDGLKKVL